MLRRTPLYAAVSPEMVSSGLQPDKHSLHKLLWETAENVVFFAGKVKRRVPSILTFTAGSEPIRGLAQQQATDGVRWLWAASGGDVVRWYADDPELVIDGADWQEDQTLTANPTLWDFTPYGNWMIANSSLGAAQLIKASVGVGDVDSVEDFGDAPEDVCRFLKKANFIMAFGYGARGTRVGWSDGDNIETWTATDENLASALSIDDFDTRIRAANHLGRSIAVFAEDQMALVNYLGAPFYFGQQTVLDGIGAVSKAAVCSDGKNNLGVGRGGIWWTDSNSYRYIDEGYLHDYMQNEVNWAQSGKISATRNDYTGCYEFLFPMRDSTVIDEGWCFDPRNGGWSLLPGASLKDERRLFQKVVSGGNDGVVRLEDSDPSASGPLVLATKPLLMQVQSAEGWTDVHTTCKVDEIDLLLKEAAGIEFRLGCQQDINEPFDYTSWIACNAGMRTYRLERIPDGVYWKLEFRSTLANWALDLQGFILFGLVQGTKRDTQ